MVLLRITYRVRAHNMLSYEQLFSSQVMPLIRALDFCFLGIWKTLVGEAGEYLELWEFESLAEFEKKWKQLMADPRLLQIFESTGPMVEDENLSLFEPLATEGRE